MVELVVDRMVRLPEFCAEMHRAIGCCQDGKCTKTSPNNSKRGPVPVALDAFEETPVCPPNCE